MFFFSSIKVNCGLNLCYDYSAPLRDPDVDNGRDFYTKLFGLIYSENIFINYNCLLI